MQPGFAVRTQLSSASVAVRHAESAPTAHATVGLPVHYAQIVKLLWRYVVAEKWDYDDADNRMTAEKALHIRAAIE